MSEILINDAPKEYKTYFLKADKEHGDGNGKIDTLKEASRAGKAFCQDNLKDCRKIIDYMQDQLGLYSDKLTYIQQQLENAKRGFRIIITPEISMGFTNFSYTDLGPTFAVPPHPDDPNGKTEPINMENFPAYSHRDHETINFIDFSLSATIDFWQYAFVKYRLSIGVPPMGKGEEQLEEGSYVGERPPHFRQRYSSGENAFTFVSFPGDYEITQDFLIGTFPFFKEWDSGSRNLWFIEAGISNKQIPLIKGWDRYAAVEIKERGFASIWGPAFGFGLIVPLDTRISNSFKIDLQAAVRASYYPDGSFSFQLGFGVPLVIDNLGSN